MSPHHASAYQAIQRDEKISLYGICEGGILEVSEIEFGLGEHHFSVNVTDINGLIQMDFRDLTSRSFRYSNP